ncbi:MAG: IS1634 family transposase [Dehalococcoidia bacterium]|nr:IS1634 family transposase [Dehalococcoidia bacterium]
MYLKRCGQNKSRKDGVYWELVESQRTERGPRQRVVAYLGDMDEAACVGVKQAAMNRAGSWQRRLFDEEGEPEWVEVDSKRVRVERVRDFGGYWLGLHILDKLGLISLLDRLLPVGREDIPWSMMVVTLVLMRLCEPSSELHIAENAWERSVLEDLLGIPVDKVNYDRLYRALDKLLPHKEEMEKHLKVRLGELFHLEYDLLLYDITSTYFEGTCEQNKQAQFGHSRDKRSDCKQVCIGLVVSREGMPLGYELFSGNRADVTTVKEIVEKIERQYGKANRIWVMDRGMVSEKTLALLRSEGRRYIVGTPRGQLRQFEAQLSSEEGWDAISEGLSAKLIAAEDGKEWFILCRSEARGSKEKAMVGRFEERIEEGLKKLAASCAGEKKWRQATVERRIGALLSKNSRARGLFKVQVGFRKDGGASIEWEKLEKPAKWMALKEGCYLLRTNVEGRVEELWHNYIQLTEAEAAFRIQKGDLRIRPIWHQTEERVGAHILVCFLAYVLWKTLSQMCKAAGLGNEPRKVFDEIAQIKAVDVVMPTKNGVAIRKRCISQPTKPQAILLQRLRLQLPQRMKLQKM